MPAKLILRSAILLPQSNMNRRGSELAVLHRHHSGSGILSANTIASGKDARQTGFEIGIDSNETALDFQLQRLRQRGLLLPHRLHDLVGRNHELAAISDGLRDAPA